MQLLGLGLIPFFISTLFQYVFAALDAQKALFRQHLIGSTLRVILLVTLIPRYNFVGPAIAFVCAETVTVGNVDLQLQRLGYPAHLVNIIWRPLAAGVVMAWCSISFWMRLNLAVAGAFSQFLATVLVLFAVADVFEGGDSSGPRRHCVCFSFCRVLGEET